MSTSAGTMEASTHDKLTTGARSAENPHLVSTNACYEELQAGCSRVSSMILFGCPIHDVGSTSQVDLM